MNQGPWDLPASEDAIEAARIAKRNRLRSKLFDKSFEGSSMAALSAHALPAHTHIAHTQAHAQASSAAQPTAPTAPQQFMSVSLAHSSQRAEDESYD